jgi:hypothetical protein
MTTHCVYRIYAARDHLLYIGCSSNVQARMAHHERHQPWWHLVVRVEVADTFNDRSAARAAERAAILAEQPPYNVQHTSEGIETAECRGGSPAGYRRHRRLGEEACLACKAAMTEATVAQGAASLARGSLTHGRTSTYTVGGCRCDACREALRIHMRDWRRRRASAA